MAYNVISIWIEIRYIEPSWVNCRILIVWYTYASCINKISKITNWHFVPFEINLDITEDRGLVWVIVSFQTFLHGVTKKARLLFLTDCTVWDWYISKSRYVTRQLLRQVRSDPFMLKINYYSAVILANLNTTIQSKSAYICNN